MPMTEVQAETLRVWREVGENYTEAARVLNKSRQVVTRQVKDALHWEDAAPGHQAAIESTGLDISKAKFGWRVVVDPETGSRDSVWWDARDEDGVTEDKLSDLIASAVDHAFQGVKPDLPPRTDHAEGEYLLIIDLADVHFLKLCVRSETGHTYNREVARHRVVEGTKSLLKKASGFGVFRILFVLGNDILHIDGARPKTTSGTDQDTDGSIFQGYNDAFAAIVEAVQECSKVADVDLLHCMSNHDFVVGWALSQSIAAAFKDHPNVNSTGYSMSESHRKYYRSENNLFVLTHGDGAKEESLMSLAAKEARSHLADAENVYALLHHFHHKIKKRRGVETFTTEKDHIGMTAIVSHGVPKESGDGIDIEYVRSPSAPDGWHDRNGYVNRQGVEAFLYHPHDGQDTRFTTWF